MVNAEDPVAQVVEPLRMLTEWREGLESNLRIPLDLPAEPQIPFEATPDLRMPLGSPENPKDLYADRALCTLHMKYNQVGLRPALHFSVLPPPPSQVYRRLHGRAPMQSVY